MKKQRKPIPKYIERQIKVEAGHKCTIWNCNEKYGLEKHHIDGNPSNNDKDNIIYLCATHHKMADDGLISQKECSMYKQLLKEKLDGKISYKNDVHPKSTGIEVEPESSLEKFIFWSGKKYVLWRYHDFNVSLNKEIGFLSILSVISFIPSLFFTWNITNSKTFDLMFFTISMFSVIIGLVIITYIVVMIKSRCPKCNKNFGIRRIKSFEIGRKKIHKNDYGTKYEVTYDNTYKCDFCNYNYQRKERETETISNQ